jgi:hypothetical protein
MDSAIPYAIARWLSGKINLLIVEDDETLLSALEGIFSVSCMTVAQATTIGEARSAIARPGTAWHCWIVDLCLGGKKNAGMALIEENNDFPFAIVYSGIGSMESASHAIQKGAEAVIDKGGGSIAKLIGEVCGVAPLAVLCNGKISKNKEMLYLLKNHVLRLPKDWAEKSCMSVRQLENITFLHTGMRPSHVIPFYYGLRFLLLTDMGGKEPPVKKEELAFYKMCVDFLQKNLPAYKDLLFRE